MNNTNALGPSSLLTLLKRNIFYEQPTDLQKLLTTSLSYYLPSCNCFA